MRLLASAILLFIHQATQADVKSCSGRYVRRCHSKTDSRSLAFFCLQLIALFSESGRLIDQQQDGTE